jgi:small subunit ribosomal protein S1
MTVKAGEKPTSINDLKPKMELTGVVKKVELFGAFVDVGVGQDGLLHISQLSAKHVRNVTDVVKEGDEVNVWVMDVDRDKRRFNLTLIRPPEVTWDELKVGGVVTGTVTRIERFGAFVDIGAERNGRIHVSELAADYVKDPGDVVKVGDKVRVKILNVNPGKRQIDLSIKALEEAAVVENVGDQSDEKVPTAMELALRRAMQGTDLEGELPRRRDKKKKRRDDHRARQQADILARTLQHRKN